MNDPVIDRLRRVAAALRSGQAPEPADAQAHALGIDEFSSGRKKTLDEAFGLQPNRPGQRSFGTTQAIANRDRFLCEAAALFFRDDPSIAEQARNICRKLMRYRAAAWLKDRLRDECPYRAGQIEEFFWKILRARDADLSESRIRTILGAGQE